MRLFRANLRKLARRPATWVTILLLIGLLALIFLAVAASSQQGADAETAAAAQLVVTFPEAYRFVLGVILGIGGLLAVTYGGAIAGSEWSWGTLKVAVARGEGRVRYVIAGFAAVAAFVAIGILVAFVAGVVFAVVGAMVLGLPLDGMGDATALGELPEAFGRAAIAMAMNTALGFTIATVARSQLAGIAVGIGVYFTEGIAGIFLPDVIQWFPFAAANAAAQSGGRVVVEGGGGGGLGTSLDPNTALVVVLAWLIGSLAVASLWTERAEIGG